MGCRTHPYQNKRLKPYWEASFEIVLSLWISSLLSKQVVFGVEREVSFWLLQLSIISQMNCPSTQYPFGGCESTEKPLLCMPRQNFAGWILDNLSNQSGTIFPRIIAFHERFNVDWRQNCKMKNKNDSWHFKASTFWQKYWTKNQQNPFDPTTPSVSCTWEARSGEPRTKVWWDVMLPILEGLQPVGFSSWGRKTCVTRNTTPPPPSDTSSDQ